MGRSALERSLIERSCVQGLGLGVSAMTALKRLLAKDDRTTTLLLCKNVLGDYLLRPLGVVYRGAADDAFLRPLGDRRRWRRDPQ
jgi:hypothetical protein